MWFLKWDILFRVEDWLGETFVISIYKSLSFACLVLWLSDKLVIKKTKNKKHMEKNVQLLTKPISFSFLAYV